MNRFLSSPWTKAGVFLLGLVPLAVLVWFGFQMDLTANPIEYVTHYTGDWTIRFICITLCITPLRMLLNRPQITRFRRMLGLYAFFYGCLHLAIWVVLDPRQNTIPAIWEDIAKRRYITVGMLAFLAMLPLAITSTAGWVRRLTFKRWKRLHRLVYLTAIAGVIHYWWLVKSDIRKPLMYAAIVTLLLGYRVVSWMRKRKPVAEGTSQPTVSAR
ncbi:MAG: Ferric reductase domain protein transrane component, N-terminal domain [Bryobacterales bacterium]|jgi:sulfoxide reductase heme-binding subunit YedZ|nr:Ferric reductase domain protein transrane component, N-terminal domain [Bryobacterales bacterium]